MSENIKIEGKGKQHLTIAANASSFSVLVVELAIRPVIKLLPILEPLDKDVLFRQVEGIPLPVLAELPSVTIIIIIITFFLLLCCFTLGFLRLTFAPFFLGPIF